ncbi:hypothetical protein WN48_05550 [Eufriesea mexicana]|uniref:Uncharacterized protein n=1 Tax=Eufriesea mexicana TaxID=516756 RepID=A0A310SGU8_9HYME|nr:hypothetical protein WN48_05550 [Eufriesea mexicana]
MYGIETNRNSYSLKSCPKQNQTKGTYTPIGEKRSRIQSEPRANMAGAAFHVN